MFLQARQYFCEATPKARKQEGKGRGAVVDVPGTDCVQ